MNILQKISCNLPKTFRLLESRMYEYFPFLFLSEKCLLDFVAKWWTYLYFKYGYRYLELRTAFLGYLN